MGETTRAQMSAIGHKLGKHSIARRRSELAFIMCFLTVFAFGAGYVTGVFFPYKPKTPEWADKIGKPAAAPKRK